MQVNNQEQEKEATQNSQVHRRVRGDFFFEYKNRFKIPSEQGNVKLKVELKKNGEECSEPV